jgi:hypothetical protein
MSLLPVREKHRSADRSQYCFRKRYVCAVRGINLPELWRFALGRFLRAIFVAIRRYRRKLRVRAEARAILALRDHGRHRHLADS